MLDIFNKMNYICIYIIFKKKLKLSVVIYDCDHTTCEMEEGRRKAPGHSWLYEALSLKGGGQDIIIDTAHTNSSQLSSSPPL